MDKLAKTCLLWIALVLTSTATSAGDAISVALNLPGVDPVKVKTIPIGPDAFPAPPPGTSSTRTPSDERAVATPMRMDIPRVMVRTLRIDTEARIVGRHDPAEDVWTK